MIDECQCCGGLGGHWGSCSDINVFRPFVLLYKETVDGPTLKKLVDSVNGERNENRHTGSRQDGR